MGYNVFSSRRNTELKPTIPDWPERRKQITKEWKELGKDGQAVWNTQASLQTDAPTTTNLPKHADIKLSIEIQIVVDKEPKKVTGWNGFVREQTPTFPNIPLNERNKLIAEKWHALGEDGKALWCKEHGYPIPKSQKKQ